MFVILSILIFTVNAIPANCKTGVSANHCLECNPGYYLVVQDNSVSGIPNTICQAVPTYIY